MSLRTKVASYFLYLMQDVPHRGIDIPVLMLLEWASKLYKKGVEKKYRSYADGSAKQTKLAATVISLGNITVGGTGKTPTACMIARYLQHQGLRVALLNRGYRSANEHGAAIMSDGEHIFLTAEAGGDEACLMARSLPKVPVVVGRERAKSGALAIDTFGSDVLLLDDGFQHWQLYRDLDIVLVDGTNPFGNGYVLPRGILREPMEHLQRAGLFIITKADQAQPAVIEDICRVLRRYQPKAPIAQAIHKPTWCISFSDWNSMKERSSCERLHTDTPVIAVSALGNPASFEKTVESFGYTLAAVMRYDDHHHYSAGDIADMAAMAREKKAVIVTTEKDAVKMDLAAIAEQGLSIYVLGIEIEIIKGNDEIKSVLHQVLGG